VADIQLEPHRDGATLVLPDDAGGLQLLVACSQRSVATWLHGEKTPPCGWQSLYYNSRHPTWSLAVDAEGTEATFVTLVGTDHGITLLLNNSAELAALWAELNPPDGIAAAVSEVSRV
jgi:hypothetical protein